ncbi:expressed unknown protein [Seminavis robusta]|uniref:Uncharacterized protein n=1 Tax=Seminavis robusta TaxID=568900 RepID=A0A9N8DIJ5_9STRA|nr:expressed unknown protein [Seminavis robusta]|eukprot:Sro82_g043690.1 n/a (217) ;mRNA; f:11672-12322
MVVQGSFSLRLINAANMKQIPEHSSSTGKVFVTMKPNEDFFVQLEVNGNSALQDRNIVYQTFVSNNHSSNDERKPRSSFKRRLTTTNQQDHERRMFRFENPTKGHPHASSGVMEKVTVRVYEQQSSIPSQAGTAKRRLLVETITIHCLVLPSSSSKTGLAADVVSRIPAIDSLDAGKISPSVWGSHQTFQCMYSPLTASRISPDRMNLQKARRLIL